MYIFCDKEIENPLYIHFLCGNKYHAGDPRDKRNVLKKYIDSINNNHALILEKLFYPIEYSKMGFVDLEQVELMASHYARSIIIFQETVSTAAEVSLFASKELLKNKVLVIHASEEVAETDPVGNFIRLAYFKNQKISHKEYAFKPELHKISGKNVAYYNTYFLDEELGSDFKKELEKFWRRGRKKLNLKLEKEIAICKKENIYRIDKNAKKVYIKLNYDLILTLLISILLNSELIDEIRDIDEAITRTCDLFKKILTNTIEYTEIEDFSSYSMTIKTIDGEDINLPIKFCMYILEKSHLINIENKRISVTNDFKRDCREYRNFLKKPPLPDFFEGDING